MNRLIGMTFAMLAGLAAREAPAAESPLRGTWVLVAADKILSGGERVRDYGEKPKGRLIVDAAGRYSLQIFKSERLRFATDSKADGSADEFKSAAMGSSTHYGSVTVDDANGLLVFSIEGSSFPNWEGTVQKRQYALDGGTLTYRVPPRADGSIPVSVWRKLD
ncbi:lipocalin-like domain-containing protein [Pseudoxanthomonas helianthi]|uniref:Lipocalin-like domain-containing protein n=1 Tax=Pseudoxanthomonas helianthi TaxID=1453541 RepID=A0A940X459_9GAMM|nr:lipocalin-like domain-containing protein [Pseudoxanthomonas helianthi]MBP3984295.1 lipocalin-like domain-containing protein [Pseudoxanthomonas helianthi]